MIRAIIFIALFAFSGLSISASIPSSAQTTLILNASTPSVGTSYLLNQNTKIKVWRAELVGVSAVSATVVIRGDTVECNSTSPIVATITLSSSSRIQGLVTNASWSTMCGELVSISGVGASVTLTVGQ